VFSRSGFGNTTIDNSFWAGLDLISSLTLQGYTRVRFEMFSAVSLGWYSVEYSSISVGPSSTGYALAISGYSGDAGDAMTSLTFGPWCSVDGATFATFDYSANGLSSNAAQYGGGWWYTRSCLASNLNGMYLARSSAAVNGIVTNTTAMYWGVTGGTGPPNVSVASGVMPGSLAISRIMLRRP